MLALFAAALVVTLDALRRLEHAEREVATLEDAKHAGHRAASLVREMYIHQAHTIIEWNRSHVAHYEEFAVAARAACKALVDHGPGPDERSRAEQIVGLAAEVDESFQKEILPAIDRGDRELVAALHGKTERRVTKVVELCEALNRTLEDRTLEARAAEDALREQARRWLIGCFALAIIVSAGVALAMTRWVSRRLEWVRQGANRLAAGQHDVRIAVDGRDEYGELANAFNQMASALERHQAERTRESKLAAVGEIAAGVAHEINNPLGVILGYVRLLRRDSLPPETEEALGIIEDETRQCLHIVRSLLDLARAPSSSRTPLDLTGVARDAVARLEDSGLVAPRAIDWHAPTGPVWAVGDEVNLRQVVTNLLLNAAEATDPGERILVELQSAGDEVEIAIIDQGCGIPPEVLPRVTDPFFTTKPSGTGLGLAISNAIVRAHGGRLLITSSSEGTRAAVRLPAASESHGDPTVGSAA